MANQIKEALWKNNQDRDKVAHLNILSLCSTIVFVLEISGLGIELENDYPTVEPQSSNIDYSFTMANSHSFLNPYEIFPIAQETNI